MRSKTMLCLLTFALVSLGSLRADDAVPFETLQEIADRNAEAMWGQVSSGDVFEYHSLQGGIVAYAFNYRLGDVFPSNETVVAESETARQARDRFAQWGADEYGYMVMSAHASGPPFICYGKRLTPEYACGALLEAEAKEALGTQNVEFTKAYYLTPIKLLYEFTDGKNRVYVQAFPPVQTFDETEFQTQFVARFDEIEEGKVAQSDPARWDFYLSGGTRGGRYDQFIPYQYLCPFYDWSYGCSPTAGAMLLGWWDYRSSYLSTRYGKFVDYHFERWDHCQVEQDYQVPNLQKELCIAMNTDSMDGGTDPDDIGPGMVYNANTTNEYSFSQTTTYDDPLPLWNIFKGQIDADRPVHTGVPGHSMCGIGYAQDSVPDMIIVHNTWNPPNDYWDYTQFYRMTTVTQGGYYGYSPVLEAPLGDTLYNHNGSGETWYAGGVHEVDWDQDGGAGYAKVWISTNGGISWSTIASNTDNDGSFIWHIPTTTTSNQARVAVAVHETGTGANWGCDGSLGNFKILSGGSFLQLYSDGEVDISGDPTFAWLDQDYGNWSAVGIRGLSGSDWDMSLWDDSTFTTHLTTSAWDGMDFLVWDANHAPLGDYGVKAWRYSGSGDATIEYEDFYEILENGMNDNIHWPAGDVVEIWDVLLEPDTYTFTLDITSGSADLGIAIFNSNGAPWYGDHNESEVLADAQGPGGDESFTYTAPNFDYYGVMVFAKDESSAYFDIVIEKQGGVPDLYIADYDIVPTNPTPGSTVDFDIVIGNQGDGTASGFYTDWYQDRTTAPGSEVGDQAWYRTSLPANDTARMSGSYTYNGGVDSTWVQTDTDQMVAESNEGNNIYGPEIVSQHNIYWLYHESCVVPPEDTTYFRYFQDRAYWAFTGVRPADTGGTNDWNVRIYEDVTYSTMLELSGMGMVVDFVACDYNHAPTGHEGAMIYRWSGSGDARAEYEDYTETLTVNDTVYYIWTQADVVEGFDVFLNGGNIYEFTVTPTSGGLDLGAALFYSGDGDYYKSRNHAEVLSDGNVAGDAEVFAYEAPANDWYGYVVFSNDDLGGNYWIGVIECGACGDANGVGGVTAADGYHVLNYLGGGPAPLCLWSCDVNASGSVTSADGYHILNYLGAGPALNCTPVMTRMPDVELESQTE
jgi:hypothetical protein